MLEYSVGTWLLNDMNLMMHYTLSASHFNHCILLFSMGKIVMHYPSHTVSLATRGNYWRKLRYQLWMMFIASYTRLIDESMLRPDMYRTHSQFSFVSLSLPLSSPDAGSSVSSLWLLWRREEVCLHHRAEMIRFHQLSSTVLINSPSPPLSLLLFPSSSLLSPLPPSSPL